MASAHEGSRLDAQDATRAGRGGRQRSFYAATCRAGALGRRISIRGAEGPFLEIAASQRRQYATIGEAPQPFLYLTLAQNPRRGMTMFVPPRRQDEFGRRVPGVQSSRPNLPLPDLRMMNADHTRSAPRARRDASWPSSARSRCCSRGRSLRRDGHSVAAARARWLRISLGAQRSEG